jgi:hypothetical protein
MGDAFTHTIKDNYLFIHTNIHTHKHTHTHTHTRTHTHTHTPGAASTTC